MGHGPIADDIINQVRDRVDIIDIVGQHVRLLQLGQNFRGLCPFHQEKTPSFNVNPSRQIFHCFGCGVGGNVFTFLMRITGATFPEIVRELGHKVGVSVPESAGRGSDREEVAARGRLEKVNEAAAAWFRRDLLQGGSGREAAEYLEERGIRQETCERFRIGFAAPAWDGLLKALLSEGYTVKDLAMAGLAVAKDQGARNSNDAGAYYDRFRGRVMFPITDLRRRIVAFGGRVLGSETPKYLNSPDTPLFKKGQTLFALDVARDAASRLDCLIIVEGYFDVIALHQAGITNVAATLGTALTIEHVNLIRRFVMKVVLLFDPDQAGVKAALRTLDLFVNSGLGVKVVSLPEGDDPDTFVRKQGPEVFHRLLERAPSLLDFALEHSLKTVESGSIEERIRSVDEVLRIIQRGDHPIEREERLHVVTERLGINQQRLIERYPGLTGQDARKMTKPVAGPVTDVRFKGSPEERDLVHLLLQGLLSPADVRRLRSEAFTVPGCRRIVECALQHVDNDGRVRVRETLDAALAEPDCGSLATELSMLERHYDDVKAYIQGCLDTLDRKKSDILLRELIVKLKAAERDGRHEDAQGLLVQVNELRMRKAGASPTA